MANPEQNPREQTAANGCRRTCGKSRAVRVGAIAVAAALACAAGVAIQLFKSSTSERETDATTPGTRELDELIGAVCLPTTSQELLERLATLPENDNAPISVALRSWVDARDRNVWPAVELFARRTKLLKSPGAPRPWLEEFRADEARNLERLELATRAINDGIERLYEPLVNVYDKSKPAPSRTPNHLTFVLVSYLANIQPDASSQLAAASRLQDFGLSLPVESIARLSMQAKRRLEKRSSSL